MTRSHHELSPTLHALRLHADQTLLQALPGEDDAPRELHRAMRYAVLNGGKRLRAMLVYATGQALGASLDRLDAPACAVEIIHAYSLVHDDLPAMDDDDLRRGIPTCHVAFGEAMAILAGDALQALAFECLANDAVIQAHAERGVTMLQTLATACGSQGMAGGQALDLGGVGQVLTPAQLECMHVRKTGALIRASVRLGALAAGCTQMTVLEPLDRYAHCIGLAFQIRDDILDVESESAQLGKTAGKDQAAAKPTYPAILGMAESRRQLAALTGQALDALPASLEDAGQLADLARFVADRSN